MYFLLYLFSLCALIIKDTSCLDLTDIKVPAMALVNGQNDTEPITMDCVYQLNDDDDESSSLVVKWLKDNQLIYQWIRGQEPIVFPAFKDKVSAFSLTSDENKQYRAIQVQRNVNATGTYKCMVYTTKETESMEKKLQVVDIQDYTIRVHPTVVENYTIVECIISHIYPEATLELVTDDNDTVQVIDHIIEPDDDGYYNTTLLVKVNDDDDDRDEFQCIAKFEGLSFTLTTSAQSHASLPILSCHVLSVIILSYFTSYAIVSLMGLK